MLDKIETGDKDFDSAVNKYDMPGTMIAYWFYHLGKSGKVKDIRIKRFLVMYDLFNASIDQIRKTERKPQTSAGKGRGCKYADEKECPVCGERYKNLKSHMRAHENNPDEYPVVKDE